MEIEKKNSWYQSHLKMEEELLCRMRSTFFIKIHSLFRIAKEIVVCSIAPMSKRRKSWYRRFTTSLWRQNNVLLRSWRHFAMWRIKKGFNFWGRWPDWICYPMCRYWVLMKGVITCSNTLSISYKSASKSSDRRSSYDSDSCSTSSGNSLMSMA